MITFNDKMFISIQCYFQVCNKRSVKLKNIKPIKSVRYEICSM